MSKIFLGGPGSCSVHFEKDMIISFIDTYYTKYELTENYKEADIIVIVDTCMGTYENLERSINYIENIIKYKKSNSQVITSGCLTKGVKFELTDKQKSILAQTKCLKQSELIEYICKLIKPNFDIEFEDVSWLDDFSFPYEWSKNGISFSIVEGCSNNCSFCKSNYMNFPVKSIPYEKLERMTEGIIELDYPFNYMQIHSSNLSLYGIDLYGKQRTHEAIKILSSPECIKFLQIGCLINFYPELIQEIIENPKIKTVFISLESGSERIYNLMNRPISLDNLIKVIKKIKQSRPDIIIYTEIICGFPTETLDDIKRSIELIQELDIIPLHAHPYVNSKQIPSSKLPQHTSVYNEKCKEYVQNSLQKTHENYRNKIINGEMIVIEKNEIQRYYTMLLVNGSIIHIGFEQLEKEYNINDIVKPNTIIKKQVAKRRILQK